MSSNPSMGLSVGQVANRLGVSIGTVRRWADLGFLPFYRTPGGQRRFSQDQIDAFLAEQVLPRKRLAGRP